MAEISRGRKALFVAIMLAGVIVLLELGSFAIHAAFRKRVFTYEEYERDRVAVRTAVAKTRVKEFGAFPTGVPPGSIWEVLHPYLGFVQDPTRTAGHSDLGFPDGDVRLYRKDPKRVVIGVFGGSVAEALSRTTKDVIIERLGKSPRFAGKEIKVLTIAMGGYKQPQQLIALVWLLSLGVHFDVIVNLDGFNEVSLPVTENLPKGVSPFYPRNWYGRLGALDSTMFALSRRHSELLESRAFWAGFFSSFPLRWSVTANVAWRALDVLIDLRINAVAVEGQAHKPVDSALPYSTRGPAYSYADEDATYDDLVRMWKDASIQMKAIAAANGATYLHFLQPNQYVAGSKEMGEEERRIAIDEKMPYRAGAVRGYPKLIAAGADLRKSGVAFFDLTRILAPYKQPLYIDNCCHYGTEANRILATRIADEIVNAK